jgi:hypothetical protein
MRIHLIDGEKGGVGKSWLAFVMAEYLRSKLIQFYLYAADRSNPTAASRYKDKERYAEFYDDSVHYTLFSENIKKIDEPDVLLEMAMERTIVLDLPAQVYYPLTSWIEEKDIFELSKANQIDWVRWFVCNGEDESIQLLISSMEFYKHQQTVLVKNWGLCDNWDYFDGHEALQAVIKKHRIVVIDFPKLADSKRIAINAKRWTFDEARELGQFGLVGKSEIYKYTEKAYQVLASTQLLEV